MTEIRLDRISKTYNGLQVFKDLSLTIRSGEFVVFVGPSGCGKSTLLRMIAGLEETTGGTITIDGKDVTRAEPHERGLAMVFQSYALYPHMTVRENIAFALEAEKLPKAEIETRVAEAVRALQIGSYLDRKPKALSGGQRQRVAIGRAIVRKPRAFLFDEPLSNLDAALRTDTRIEIAALHRQLGATMLYVTHDQVEAMTLADRIVVLSGGKIMQVGTPEELYTRPANEFVAQFIGSPKMNMLPVTSTTGAVGFGRTRLEGQVARIGLRPEVLQLLPAAEGRLAGVVAFKEYLGADLCIHIDLDDGLGRVVLRQQGGMPAASEGEAVGIGFDPAVAHLFDRETNAIF